MLETIGNSAEQFNPLIWRLATQYTLLKFPVLYTKYQKAEDKLGLTSWHRRSELSHQDPWFIFWVFWVQTSTCKKAT